MTPGPERGPRAHPRAWTSCSLPAEMDPSPNVQTHGPHRGASNTLHSCWQTLPVRWPTLLPDSISFPRRAGGGRTAFHHRHPRVSVVCALHVVTWLPPGRGVFYIHEDTAHRKLQN